jgi:radical SAM superfamily enzyme YgiQ (UPF0313 family)
MRSAENIADEIEYVINKYGIRDLSLWDDTFTLNRKRVYEFCDELNRRRIRIYWSVNVRADTVDYSVLKLMKSAGDWCAKKSRYAF